MGRGNQYIQLVKVLYCKLLTNGKQLPAFPLDVGPGFNLRGGRRELTRFIYLFGIFYRFQHCTGHITTGRWKGRGNQYFQFIRVLYCKLLINSKQLPTFSLEAVPGTKPRPQRWEASVTTRPPWPLQINLKFQVQGCVKDIFKIISEVYSFITLVDLCHNSCLKW